MVGLPEIYQFEAKAPVGHDVAGLKVQVGDAVFLQVSEGLRDSPDEVEFGVEGEGLLVA